jgi:WD40 repeat protein
MGQIVNYEDWLQRCLTWPTIPVIQIVTRRKNGAMRGYHNQKIVAVFLWIGICCTVWACAALAPVEQPAVSIEDAHPASAVKVAFSPDNQYLASSGYFGEIKVWSLPDLKPVLTFSEHRRPPYGLLWLDDQNVISADSSGRIYSWRITDGKVLQFIKTSAGIAALAVSVPQNRLISGHSDGMLRVFDAVSFKPMAEYDVGSRILAIAADRTQSRVAVSCDNRQILLFDPDRGQVKALASPPRRVFDVAFSPDGRHLAGGGWFKLFFWDIAKNMLTIVETDHHGAVYSIDYTPDGKYLATIGRHTDSQILLVDLGPNTTHRRLLRHNLCGTVVRISPDGRYLASGSDDASIRLYDLSDRFRKDRPTP